MYNMIQTTLRPLKVVSSLDIHVQGEDLFTLNLLSANLTKWSNTLK